MVELNVIKTKAEGKYICDHWTPMCGSNVAFVGLNNPINYSMSIAAQTKAIEDSLNAMTLSVNSGVRGLQFW